MRGELSPADRALVQIISAAFPLDERFPPTTSPPITDWHAVVMCARLHGLAPLLFKSLQASGLRGALPPDLLEKLRVEFLRTTVTLEWMYAELGRLLDCFAREQIPIVLLKGCALGPTLYPNVNLRPLGDLDFLIPQAQAARVESLLTQQGYASALNVLEDAAEQFSCEACFVSTGKFRMAVEPHWHIVYAPYYRAQMPIEWFWQRTTGIQVNGRAARIFAPGAQLLHLVSHLALHHQGKRLLWYYDIARLLARYREEINWDEVFTAAYAFRLTEPSRATLAQVEEMWGVAIPATVWDGLRADARARVQFAMETASHIDARVLWDAAHISGVRSKLAFLARTFFPTPAYMRVRYHVTDARRLPLYYLLRLGTGAYKFAVSAISMIINVWRTLTRAQDA